MKGGEKNGRRNETFLSQLPGRTKSSFPRQRGHPLLSGLPDSVGKGRGGLQKNKKVFSPREDLFWAFPRPEVGRTEISGSVLYFLFAITKRNTCDGFFLQLPRIRAVFLYRLPIHAYHGIGINVILLAKVLHRGWFKVCKI